MNTVGLNKLGGKTVVTALISGTWETCIYYIDGENDIVATYDSEKKAVEGHNAIVRHELNHADAQNNNRQMWVQS